MINSKQTHSGQFRPYGDYIREWEVEGDTKDNETVLEYCFENLSKRVLPEKSEFMRSIKYGTGSKSGDAGYYFAGYYQLTKADGKYKFTTYEPYAD